MSVQPGAERQHSSRDTVADHWGAEAPEWLTVLAEACDAPGSSQAKVARRIGCSAATVSAVFRRRYKAGLDAIEQRVRDHLMSAPVLCPGLKAEIPMSDCVAWQQKPYAATNPTRVRMFRACRSGCPHSRLNGGSDDQ